MKELNIFKEIPGSEKFHSCLLASYSLDYYFFEQRVVSALRSKGIRNISVITDTAVSEDYMKNMLGNIKKISSLYSHSTIIANGAFHPKLYMFFGDKAALMIIGSGNLTSGGMGKNHELFISFYADSQTRDQLPLILEGWHYLRSVTSATSGIALRQQKWIIENCSLLGENTKIPEQNNFIPIDNGTEVSFLHNTDGALWDKMKALIDNPGSITRITVASPYFDKNGAFLDQLIKHFPKANTEIFIQDKNVLLPLDYKAPAPVKFYKWDETDIAVESRFKKHDRFQHSKLLHLQAGNAEYLLLGSPNATSPGFLYSSAQFNAETAVLLKGKNVNWLSMLGITGKKVPIDLSALPAIERVDVEKQRDRRLLYKIEAIDRYAKEFTVYINKPIQEGLFIRLFDSLGDKLEDNPISSVKVVSWAFLISSVKLAEQVVFGAIFNEKGIQVSNSQLINNAKALETTHPSRENRRINKLLDKMMEGKYSELDLFDFYEAIRTERKFPKKTLTKPVIRYKTDNKDNDGISYEQAMENMLREKSVIGLEDFEPVRIWDTYFAKLEQELRAREEEEIDDDEDGDLRTGKGREEKNKKSKVFESRNLFERARDRVSHLFETYANGLIEATADALEKKGEYKITRTDYAFFLLTTSHLIDIAGKEYSYREKNKEETSKVLLPFIGPLDEYRSFDSISVDIIGKFLLFLQHAVSEMEYTDEYEVKKLGHFKQMAWGKILTMLSIIELKCRGEEEKYWNKWNSILVLNSIGKFQSENLPIRDILSREFRLLSIEKLSVEAALQKISPLVKKAHFIINSDPGEQLKHDLVFTNQLGFCFIEERLPRSENAKFFRISNPGLEFEDGDFKAKKLYSPEKEKFYSSFKRLGEIYSM